MPGLWSACLLPLAASAASAQAPAAVAAREAPEASCVARRSAWTAPTLFTSLAIGATIRGHRWQPALAGGGAGRASLISALDRDPGTPWHIAGSQTIASSSIEALRASCNNSGASVVRGALLAASIGLLKEVADRPTSGFSTSDLTADALGIAVAVSSARVDALRALTWSLAVDPRTMRASTSVPPARSTWLSMPLSSFRTRAAAHPVARAVRLSAGRRGASNAGRGAWMLGLDLDPSLGQHPDGWMGDLWHALRVVHLPGPAIVVEGGRARGVALAW